MCPRCGGRMLAGEDGPTCVACGHIDYGERQAEAARRAVEQDEQPPARRWRRPTHDGHRL